MSDIQYKAVIAITTANAKGGNRKTFVPGDVLEGLSDQDIDSLVKAGHAVPVQEVTVLEEVKAVVDTSNAPAAGGLVGNAPGAGGAGTGGAAGGQPS